MDGFNLQPVREKPRRLPSAQCKKKAAEVDNETAQKVNRTQENNSLLFDESSGEEPVKVSHGLPYQLPYPVRKEAPTEIPQRLVDSGVTPVLLE